MRLVIGFSQISHAVTYELQESNEISDFTQILIGTLAKTILRLGMNRSDRSRNSFGLHGYIMSSENSLYNAAKTFIVYSLVVAYNH